MVNQEVFNKPNKMLAAQSRTMKRNLLIVLLSFLASWLLLAFWSMVLNLLMLPYNVYRVFAPRSQSMSNWLKKAFESKKAKRFIGAGLAMVLMFSGVISSLVSADEGMVDNTLITSPVTEVVTERTLDVPVVGIVAQGFYGFHRAVDILAPIGTPIKPMANGIVREASFGRIGWGNTIVVEHEDGLVSRYAHLRDIKVVEGEMVNKGQEIGTVGLTGWTTGPHLHLEVYENGVAIDPLQILPEFNYQLAGK